MDLTALKVGDRVKLGNDTIREITVITPHVDVWPKNKSLFIAFDKQGEQFGHIGNGFIRPNTNPKNYRGWFYGDNQTNGVKDGYKIMEAFISKCRAYGFKEFIGAA